MGKDITINYFQAVHVAKVVTNLAPYSTIQGAIDAITDNSATKRYAVYVHPGTYTEQIIMEDYIDVIAVGGREETIITHLCTADNQTTVTGENAMIKGFTIVSDGATGAWTTRCVTNALDGFELEDCVLIATAPAAAAVTFSATASCTMRSCQVDILAAAATAVSLDTDTENYVLYDNLIGGAITSLLINDCLTTTISGGELRNLLDHDDCATSTIARNVNFEEIDFDGGTELRLDACYVKSIAANTGGAVVAYGGTIRLCNTKVTGASFIWWLDDDNLHVLENMLIQDAITAASPEDVIHLDAVRYTERITLADGVHIEGATDTTDTPTEIYDTTAAAVITAGVVESSIRQVKITQTNAGAAAYCVSVTDAAVLVFSHCTFDCNGTDAIHMVNGSLTLDKCTIADGDINILTATCILTLDHCTMAGPAGNADLEAAGGATENHEITCLHTDFGANSVNNASTGDTILVFKYCSDITNFTDAGTNAVVGEETIIENTIIDGIALKSGTTPWYVRLARIGTIRNTNATGAITIWGGYLGACTDSTGDIYWWHDNGNELMVISGMKVVHAITAANADGTDTIRLGKGTWAESALTVEKSINFIGEGLEESLISTGDDANPIFKVGDLSVAFTAVTCTFQGLTIQNTGTQEGIQLVGGADGGQPTTVIARECYLEGDSAAVELATAGNGVKTFEAFECTFFADTTCIDVDANLAVADIDLHNCEVTGGAFANLAGAAHTLDVWDTECGGGAVTGDGNNPVVNLTRCNDVGTITNAGTAGFVIEHCTTGNIALTNDGDVTIENSNIGILSDTDADADALVYNSYVTKAAPTLGDMTFYSCEIAEIEAVGGTVTVHGGNIQLVSNRTGAIIWWEGDRLLKVMASTANMKIVDALGVALAGDTVSIGQGTFIEDSLSPATGVDIIGEGKEVSIIDASAAGNPVFAIGDNISITIRGITIDNDAAGGAITISPVDNNSALVLEDCDVINAGVSNCVVVSIGGGGNGTLTARRTDFTSDGASSIVVLTRSAGAGLPIFNSDLCTFTTSGGADKAAIEASAATVVADVNVTRATFTSCTLAVYSKNDNHTIDIDDSEFNNCGVELNDSTPVPNFTKCNAIGAFAHDTACTVTLRDCYVQSTYTIAAVAGVIAAYNTQFAAFVNNGNGANITFQECFGTDFSNNLTSSLTIEGGNWDTVLQAATAGTIYIYEATIATELDCSNTGNINAYNCHVATVDANAGGTVTLYGGSLADVADATGTIVWWEAPRRLRVIEGSTADMKIMDAADAAAAGDVIVIGPGTFAEALVLDAAGNACTYQGAGREDTLIQLAAADVVTITQDGVVLEDLTIEITGGAGHDCITTANATVIRHCNIIATSAAVTECHGIATTGSGGVTVDGCDITSSGHADSDGINLQGTGATILLENIINATLADINQQADITNDLQTYNNELRGGGFKIGNNAAYNCYAHGDVFLAVTHDGLGHMFLQNEPNIALVREGMYITDGIALATADTPSAANPWKVQVGPGVYTEQVAMDDYVDVVAEAGYEVTKIKHTCTADDQPTVTMESNCRLEGFGILSDGVTDGGTWRAQCVYSAAKSNWLIKDCLLQQVNSAVANNICVFIDTSGTGMRLEHCRWFSGEWPTATTDDIKRGLQVDAAGIEVLLQDCETYGEDYDFYLNEGKVETRNCMITGGGWYISDDADSIGVSWDDDWEGADSSPVVFGGTSGQFADLSGARLYTCTVDETLGEAVYISAADTVDEATNAAATPLPAEGIIVYKPSTTTAYVKKHGYVYLADPGTLIGVTFTAGGNIWLGVTGAWLAAAPSNAIKQVLGVAKGPTGAGAAKEFLIDISLVVIETASFTDHTPTGGVLSIPIAWGAGSAATGTHISNNARRAVVIVNAAGQTVFSQAVDIPSDYLHDAANNKLFAVLFPTGGAATDIDWTAYTCCASHGEDEAFHSDTATADDQDVDDDEILFLDISAAFLTTYTAEEGDVLSIELIIDVMDAPVTQVNVLEFKLIYTRQV